MADCGIRYELSVLHNRTVKYEQNAKKMTVKHGPCFFKLNYAILFLAYCTYQQILPLMFGHVPSPHSLYSLAAYLCSLYKRVFKIRASLMLFLIKELEIRFCSFMAALHKHPAHIAGSKWECDNVSSEDITAGFRRLCVHMYASISITVGLGTHIKINK